MTSLTAALRFFHVLFIVLWLGTASGEIVLELILWRTASAARQRAYIDLHRVIDLALEGPALILATITGVWLLARQGYLDERWAAWPAWLEDKLLAAACVITLNLICVVFVWLRARATDQILDNTPPLSQTRVRRWHLAVTSTFIGVPFALIALWLAVNKSA